MPRSSEPDEAVDVNDVRRLDALCARAWAPFEHLDDDGWVLRAADGFSLRANSVWAREAGHSGHIAERIARAEDFYTRRGLTPCFQISPASLPTDLPPELARHGYRSHTSTDVMVAKGVGAPPRSPVERLEAPEGDWRRVMLDSADDRSDAQGRLVIVDRMTLRRCHAVARIEGEAAAIGLAVADGASLGIFAMRTHPTYRRRGLARAVVAALREWGALQGAVDAYLQVETDNAAAIALYHGLGFARLYRYRYYSRV